MKNIHSTRKYFALCVVVGFILFMLNHLWETRQHDIKRSVKSPNGGYDNLILNNIIRYSAMQFENSGLIGNESNIETGQSESRADQEDKVTMRIDWASFDTGVTDDIKLYVTETPDVNRGFTEFVLENSAWKKSRKDESEGRSGNEPVSDNKNMEGPGLEAVKQRSDVDIKQGIVPSDDMDRVLTEVFPDWTTTNPHDKTFTRRLYLYSAIIALHAAPSNGTDVHLVAFQDGRQPLSLSCCLAFPFPSEGQQPFVAEQRAAVDFSVANMGRKSPHDLSNIGVVYRCRFPFSRQQMRSSRVTLSASGTSCPVEADSKRYLTVYEPETKPGGLAICAKIAYGLRLDPEKLVEWFEMQRILGVDRIQLFDLNNTRIIKSIFQHYQDIGFLHLMPYKLPGRPWGRFVLQGNKDWTRYGDDKEVPIWDCRLRLAGHEHVMTLDLDEVIMPRQFTHLKPFLKREFSRHSRAAGLFFKVQFFLSDWGPTDPLAPLLFLRYLNSTAPRWEVHKHAYKPSRTHQAITHEIRPYHGYKGFVVGVSEGTVFHYRACKKVWKFSCVGPRVTELGMLRFQSSLVPAVTAVREKLHLLP